MVDSFSSRGRQLLVIALCATFLVGWEAKARAHRLNVVWIVGDDHAAYVTGCYGNSMIRTPHIDRLAAGGIRFERAYCNSPVCTASRAAFITGMYPRTVGVTQLQTPLPDSTVTLTEILRDAGYRTACWGKTHYNSPFNHGFQTLRGRDEHEAMRSGREPLPVPTGERYLSHWRPFRDPARVWLNADCLPQRATGQDLADTWFAQQAAEFLQTAGDQPFFLMVSFHAPHSPFSFPAEYRGRYDPRKMPLFTVDPDDDWQIPEVFRGLTDRDKQGIAAAYYTATEFLDRNVGIVLEALEKSGRADSTLVVYTSDHGYLLGQHGRFEKHCSYEPAARSPLIFRLPGKIPGGRSIPALVELIDVMPTLLEICGQAIPAHVQGRSLLPLLRGKATEHRQYVIVEYAPNDEAMICDGRWKLVYLRGKRPRTDGYHTGLPPHGPKVLLFDLETDAQETKNLAAQPDQAQRVNDLLALLANSLRTTARHPERVPPTDDPGDVLDYCVQPRDGEGT